MKFDPSLLPRAPDLSFEKALWAAGALRVAGLDEAGRGALAGPVAAAVVILPPDPGLGPQVEGLQDSKRMSSPQRSRWAARIQELALNWALGFATPGEIDEMGIMPATRLAFYRALAGLGTASQHLLIDHLLLPEAPEPQTALTKGDARSVSIAAASVLAKVARDEHMCELGRQFPRYGFDRHKGYGTFAHREAIQRLGPCPAHRASFSLI